MDCAKRFNSVRRSVSSGRRPRRKNRTTKRTEAKRSRNQSNYSWCENMDDSERVRIKILGRKLVDDPATASEFVRIVSRRSDATGREPELLFFPLIKAMEKDFRSVGPSAVEAVRATHHAILQKPEVFLGLAMPCVENLKRLSGILTDSQSGFTGRDEDVLNKTSALLKALLEDENQKNKIRFASTESRTAAAIGSARFSPVFAQMFLSSLRIGKSSQVLSKRARGDAIDVLRLALETAARLRPTLLVQVFPGVATGLAEIVTGSFRTGPDVKAAAFACLGTLYASAAPALPVDRLGDVEAITTTVLRSTLSSPFQKVVEARSSFAHTILTSIDDEKWSDDGISAMALSLVESDALALVTTHRRILDRVPFEEDVSSSCAEISSSTTTNVDAPLRATAQSLVLCRLVRGCLPYDALDELLASLAACLVHRYDFQLIDEKTSSPTVRYGRITDDDVVRSILSVLMDAGHRMDVVERCAWGRDDDRDGESLSRRLRLLVLLAQASKEKGDDDEDASRECLAFALDALRRRGDALDDDDSRVVETALDLVGWSVSRREQLIDVLYSVLRFDARPHRERVDAVLTRVARSTRYASRTELLSANLDYFVDDLCHQLRHDVVNRTGVSCLVASSFFSTFPLTTADTTSTTFQLVHDVLQTVFTTLDAHWSLQYSVLELLRVLHVVVSKLRVETSISPKVDFFADNDEKKLPTEILLAELEAFDVHEHTSVAADDDETADDVEDALAAVDGRSEPDPIVDVLAHVLSRAVHFASSDDPFVRRASLQVVASCVRKMGVRDVEATRPKIHETWNVLVSALAFEEIPDVSRDVLDAIAACVDAAGDFVSGRLERDAWPLFVSSGFDSNPLAVMAFLQTYPRGLERVVDDVFRETRRFVDDLRRPETREAALTLWKTLSEIFPEISYAFVATYDSLEARKLHSKGYPLRPVLVDGLLDARRTPYDDEINPLGG